MPPRSQPRGRARRRAGSRGSREPSPLRGKTEKITRLRNTIATRMVQSLQVSAQLTQVHEVDVTEVARLRARHKDAFLEREGVKLTFLPFFAKAAIEALKQYPQVNAAPTSRRARSPTRRRAPRHRRRHRAGPARPDHPRRR